MLIAALAVLIALGCAAPAAASRPGLDRSYGRGGIVQLAPPLPPGVFPQRYSSIGAAFARDGSAYASEAVSTCDQEQYGASCQGGTRVFHYLTNGSLDPAFGDAGSVGLPEWVSTIAADASGRALVAVRVQQRWRVERLLPSGQPDASFGNQGSVGLGDLRDSVYLLAPAGQGRILVGAVGLLSGPSESPLRQVTLFRLLPDGRPDRSFAGDGRASYRLGVSPLELPISIGRHGSILILGDLCCEGFHPVYRISSKGRLDTAFDAAARGAEQRLTGFGETEPSAIVSRADGSTDVLGSVGNPFSARGASGGFELRLLPSGRLDKSFGERGAQQLKLPVAAASPGVGGGTMAVSQIGETVTVRRLLADGTPDRSFAGGGGVEAPQPGRGVTLQPLAGGRVGLFDNGYRLCDEPACVTAPYLARFIEPSPPRRQGRKGGHR
ncbi:MAG: hypothetical protein U0R71_16680 [Solirubrobacterales bacterium]